MLRVQRINVETVYTDVMKASIQICETYVGCTATLWRAGHSGSWTSRSACSASPGSTASCWLHTTELHTSKEVHLSLRQGTARWRRCICTYKHHQFSMRTVRYKQQYAVLYAYDYLKLFPFQLCSFVHHLMFKIKIITHSEIPPILILQCP